MKLPKPYFSHNQFATWLKSPELYRQTYYYQGYQSFSTDETRYGSEIAKLLEKNDPSVAHVPRYELSEVVLEPELEGIKLHGRIDSFCPKTLSFLDHKTGHGKAWDKVKVQKLKQLVFYSLLIELTYGKVNNKAKLVWIETEFRNPELKYKGMTLHRKKKLHMTGKVEVFERTIFKWEREKMKKDILRVVKEISDDYAKFSQEAF